jgi:hypothetical protein
MHTTRSVSNKNSSGLDFHRRIFYTETNFGQSQFTLFIDSFRCLYVAFDLSFATLGDLHVCPWYLGLDAELLRHGRLKGAPFGELLFHRIQQILRVTDQLFQPK